MATGFYVNCTRQPGGAKGVIARNFCLSGFGGEHPSPSGRHPAIVSLCHWHIPWPVLIHLVLIGWSTTWSLTWKTVILGQTWSSHWPCTDRVLTCWAVAESRVAANPQTNPVDLGCESAENWLLPSTSTIATVFITQLVSWCSFYHPQTVEGSESTYAL